jgi:transposase-like protein
MSKQPNPTDNLDAKPFRRTFTADYKARILAEYEATDEPHQRGAILRRENLYNSHILDWRKARDAAVRTGLTDQRTSAQRAKKTAQDAEIARLKKANARLESELAKTRTALDIMGKAHALLELLSESADTPLTPLRSSPPRSRG